MRATLLALALSLAGPAAAEPDLVSARLVAPTDRYDHAVLGDALEWGALRMDVRDCATCPQRRLQVTLPETRVFEDVEARVVDADGDGQREVMVVETDLDRGAALAIYRADGQRIATGFIGQRHRWLAPAGVADLDGDGRPEIAYVETPHLGRTLVILRLEGDRLVEIARIPGLTNHRIGDRRILSGTRDCGEGEELVLARGDWSGLVALRLQGGVPRITPVAGAARPADLARALDCR